MAKYPHGIDVSNNQGRIDWAEVAGSGIQFAIAKASESVDYLDTWFGENFAGMQANGIARGAYHFARPSRNAPEAEADWFLRSIAEEYGQLGAGDVLALDLEDPYASGDLSGWTLTWLRVVEAAYGCKPLVYTSPSYANEHGLANRPEIGDYGLWLASWGVPTPPPAPAPWGFVAVHQIGVGPPGTVNGISTAIDLDRFNGSSVEQFKLYGVPAGAAPPEPVPEPEPTPPPATTGVAFDPNYPASLQNDEWSCGPTSTDWGMRSVGRTPAPEWIENDMLDLGYVSRELGIMDHTGAGIAEWVGLPDAAHYGADGFYGGSTCPISWDALVAEINPHPPYPVLMGLSHWGGPGLGHWTGIRGYDAARGVLLLANPATGASFGQAEMTRSQFEAKAGGDASMVRILHPDLLAAPLPPPEEVVPPDPPLTEEPTRPFVVGSGIMSVMTAHGDSPASDEIFLKSGDRDEYSEAVGGSGALYRYTVSTGLTHRFLPS